MNDPLKHQEGGDHYKKLPIQPVEYILANGIGFIEGNVIKYVTRHKFKNGIEDLKKARHFLDILVQHEERLLKETAGGLRGGPGIQTGETERFLKLEKEIQGLKRDFVKEAQRFVEQTRTQSEVKQSICREGGPCRCSHCRGEDVVSDNDGIRGNLQSTPLDSGGTKESGEEA